MKFNDRLLHLTHMPPDTPHDICQAGWWRVNRNCYKVTRIGRYIWWCWPSKIDGLHIMKTHEIDIYISLYIYIYTIRFQSNIRETDTKVYVYYSGARNGRPVGMSLCELGKRLMSLHVGEKSSCATAYSWCWMDCTKTLPKLYKSYKKILIIYITLWL